MTNTVSTLAACVALAAGCSMSLAQVTTVTFTGAAGNTWLDANNWSPPVIPFNDGSNEYHVVIPAGRTVYMNMALAPASPTVSGMEIDGQLNISASDALAGIYLYSTEDVVGNGHLCIGCPSNLFAVGVFAPNYSLASAEVAAGCSISTQNTADIGLLTVRGVGSYISPSYGTANAANFIGTADLYGGSMYLANTSTGTIRVFGNNEGQQNVEVGSGSVSDLQVMTGSRGYLLVVVALDLVSDSFFQLDNASSLDSSMNVITNELRDVSIVMNASDTHFRTTATQAINLSIQATTFFSTVEMSNLLSMHAEMPTLWNFGGSSWPWQFDKCQVSGDVDLRVGAGSMSLQGADLSDMGKLMIANGATLTFHNSVSYAMTDESTMNVAGELAFVPLNPGTEGTLEVGAEDVGVPAGPVTNNFEIASLRVSGDPQSTLRLVDDVDNGNRASTGIEALYLGNLSITNNATLQLGTLEAYLDQGSQWIRLRDLIPAGQSCVAFDNGFICIEDQVCYADCDGSGALNIFDYICFGNEYAAGNAYADCDGSGSLNIFDYICYGNAYAVGCP